MENDTKIERRQFFFNEDSEESDFLLEIPRFYFNYLTSKNTNISNRMDKQWNDESFQNLLKESFEKIQENVVYLEEEYGQNKILTKVKENLSDPEIFSAYVDQAIKAGIFMEILNDLISDKESFYDEKICKIFENKDFLQGSVRETESYLIGDAYTAASEYGSEYDDEKVSEDENSDSIQLKKLQFGAFLVCYLSSTTVTPISPSP